MREEVCKTPVSRYNQAYFDKWYRNPKHRVSTPASTLRKATLAVAMAEYYLERPIRTVLDIGCGEGQWQPILKKLRTKVSYLGVDPSEYAIQRHGKRRNLIQGSFTDLSTLPLEPAYDLVICSDLLYYLPQKDLVQGFAALAALVEGVAFLEAYPTTISLRGDAKKLQPRTAAFYRRLFRKHGLVSCGSHCYVGPPLAGCVTPLERGAP